MYIARPTSSPSDVIIFTGNISLEGAEFVSWCRHLRSTVFLTPQREKSTSKRLMNWSYRIHVHVGFCTVHMYYDKKDTQNMNSVGVHY